MEHSSLFIECWFVSLVACATVALFEQIREEALHAVAERYGPFLRPAPGRLGLGLRGPSRLLDLVSRRLGAADHRLADTLRGILDAAPDLLAAALYLPAPLPPLRSLSP